MDKMLSRLIDGELTELSGLTVDATLPLTESLANEIIAISLQENPQLEYCRLHIHTANQVTLDAKSPRWPWPLQVRLKLFSSVDLTRSPTVRAFLENHVLLGKLGALFNALPEGIHIYENQVSIRLESFMPSPELKKLLGLMQAMDIRTEEGRIFFDIRIRQ